jgi:hypothetical protein
VLVEPVAARGEQVLIDGSSSRAPEGGTLTYEWTLSVPSGSRASLSEATAARPTFTPDVEGDYGVRLVVRDGQHASWPKSVTIRAVNIAPTASTAEGVPAVQGEELTLQGEGFDRNGDELSYEWTIVHRPAGSTAALVGANSKSPRLVPDEEGDYEVTLVVSDGAQESRPVHTFITAYRPVRQLTHGVIDAEYSKVLERIVMVGTGPNALYIYEPGSQNETAVMLPAAPTAVSVEPGGHFAAVGHDGSISYVNLATATRVSTWPVSGYVADVVLASNGWAYVFPEGTSELGSVPAVNMSTGGKMMSSGGYIRNGTSARVHPNGTCIYGQNYGGDIQRYDIAPNGAMTVAWESHANVTGMYGSGAFWLLEDGQHLFTNSGRAFSTDRISSGDIQYVGKLNSVGLIAHLVHSATARRIAVAFEPDDFWDAPYLAEQIRLYDEDSFRQVAVVWLPRFVNNGQAIKGLGRFVFFNAAGDKMFVVQMAKAGDSMHQDFGVVTY